MIEKGLHDYLVKLYGTWESIKVISDNQKTIALKVDCGDDEIITVTINRRKGNNGNYRVVTEA